MTIGIGVLGFAHGHVNSYCKAWREHHADRVRLIAAWDHDTERLRQGCHAHGTEPSGSVDVLLARDDLAAVVIAAETSLHAELVEAAAEAGKTIILQKPAALALAEADRIVEAVRRTGVRFTLAWQMRVDPQNLEMRDLIADGAVGRVLIVRRRHCLMTHRMKGFDQTWHVKPELNRGMWADDAAHAIDFLYWLFGMPESVSAEIATLYNPQVPDDHGIAIYRYANGMMAEVVSSFVAVAGENTTEISGDRGVIIQNFGDQPSAGAPKPNGATALKWFSEERGAWQYSDLPPPDHQGVRITGLAAPLVEFLAQEREPIATAEEGRDVLRMTLASYEASEQGRRIPLPR